MFSKPNPRGSKAISAASSAAVMGDDPSKVVIFVEAGTSMTVFRKKMFIPKTAVS